MKTHQYKVLRQTKELCDTIINYCERWDDCEDCVLCGFLEEYEEGVLCPIDIIAELSDELDLPIRMEEEYRVRSGKLKKEDML